MGLGVLISLIGLSGQDARSEGRWAVLQCFLAKRRSGPGDTLKHPEDALNDRPEHLQEGLGGSLGYIAICKQASTAVQVMFGTKV